VGLGLVGSGGGRGGLGLGVDAEALGGDAVANELRAQARHAAVRAAALGAQVPARAGDAERRWPIEVGARDAPRIARRGERDAAGPAAERAQGSAPG